MDDTNNTGPSGTDPTLAAVGQLILPGGQCTGTLISPTRVLTAGHCFSKGGPPGFFSLPNGAPITYPNPVNNNNVRAPNAPAVAFPIASVDALFTADDISDHDIAIAVLQTPVPTNLVASVPRVFTGDIFKGNLNAELRQPGRIVGFGRDQAQADIDPSGGTRPATGDRRFATTRPGMSLELDDCFLDIDFHCNNNWEWEADRIVDPEPELGDSGGPLYATDPNGKFVIAGVFSGSYSPFPFFDSFSVWAPTGNPGGTNTGKFIVDHLGGDKDGDGVPDENDNCPASNCTKRGLDASKCSNPDQADSDGDGIGEACDNCPQSLCASYPSTTPHIFCRNPSQADKDFDGKGDACDLCPEAPFPSFGDRTRESDVDFDGVGDTCDACPGDTPYPICATDADCGDGTCLVESAVSPVGKCSRLPDLDGDSIPNACDECVSLASRDFTNSNSIAETRERSGGHFVQTLDDVCDPVPIDKMADQRLEVLDHVPVPGDGRDSDDVVSLDTTLSVGLDQDSPSNIVFDTRRVAYRQCNCVDPRTGAQLDLASCVGAGLTCDWSNPATSTLWKRISVVDANTNVPVMDSSGFSSPQAFLTGFSTPQSLKWLWRQDAIAGRIAFTGSCGSGPTSCKTHGVLFTGVESGATPFSDRDATLALRDVFSMFDTPRYQAFPGRVPTLPPGLLGCATIGGCVRVITAFKNSFPNAISAAFDGPTPIWVTSGSVLAFVRPGVVVDVTSLYPAGVRSTLASPARWLGAVESGRTIRLRTATPPAVRLDAAVLDRNYSGGGPLYVQTASEGFRVLNPLAPEGGTPVPSVGGPQTALSNVTGVFSKVENAVFMLGGTDPDGHANNGIWRWSIGSSRWDLALTASSGNAPSSVVLAATYDSARQNLYVLDIDDHDQTLTQKWARLVRYGLGTGASAQLLRVPYTGLFQLDSLSVLEDGSLVLVASTPLNYTAWLIDGRGPQAIFNGVRIASGLVLDGPQMGDDHPYLPVVRGTKLFQDELTPSAFIGGSPCTGL